MEDMSLICGTCGKQFVFTVADQEKYKSLGLVNIPKRCPECRARRKQLASVSEGGKFTAEACPICGGRVKLHFIPVQGRPVYCRTCYRKFWGDNT